MEADDLLCSRNARPEKALVGRAQWKINQPPSLERSEQEGWSGSLENSGEEQVGNTSEETRCRQCQHPGQDHATHGRPAYVGQALEQADANDRRAADVSCRDW
jgi:hypothetical protein